MIFDITRGDTVAVIGAGGKTTLMKFLAGKIKTAGMKPLISTTTRLGKHQIDDEFDYLVQIKDEKALAPDMDTLLQKMKEYDITLLEADGAACKRLKGWRKDEPVIPKFATVTIGVVDISLIGQTASEENIHRSEIFTSLTGLHMGDRITVQTMAKLINHKDGMFRHSNHTANCIFCAKAETPEQLANGKKLLPMLKDNIRVFAGSAQKGSVLELRY
ncbi:selenium cofactor biosynthesis protein YqeC [Deferribacteres bacterium DY0037]